MVEWENKWHEYLLPARLTQFIQMERLTTSLNDTWGSCSPCGQGKLQSTLGPAWTSTQSFLVDFRVFLTMVYCILEQCLNFQTVLARGRYQLPPPHFTFSLYFITFCTGFCTEFPVAYCGMWNSYLKYQIKSSRYYCWNTVLASFCNASWEWWLKLSEWKETLCPCPLSSLALHKLILLQGANPNSGSGEQREQGAQPLLCASTA